MKKQLIKWLTLTGLVISLLFASGCASNINSDVAPGADLNAIKTAFVLKLPADNRGIDKLIGTELSQMGIQAAFGEEVPDSEYDAIITYQDKWMWDITMYMLELQIQIKDPKTQFIIASGSSYRTSMVRKSPEEMIKEVLTEIFKKK